MLIFGIIVLPLAALALLWWFSCSLRKAVFFGQSKKLRELGPSSDLLCKGARPKYVVIVFSSLENVQKKLDEVSGGWKCEIVDPDGPRQDVLQGNDKRPLYTIKWRRSLLEDVNRKMNMRYTLERIISSHQSVAIISDVLPTFHLSRAIERSGADASEISVLSRLADLLSRFETYRFKETNQSEDDWYPVAKQARFGRQWLASTRDERVQLYALARGGFANQRRVAVLYSLLYRGLIQIKDTKTSRDTKTNGDSESSGDEKSNKVVALRDPEFGDYIRDNLDHDELKAWQREGHGNIWRKIWPPLTAVSVLALLFFLNANPEALGILLALLGATVGAAPVAISLARSWRSSGQSDSAD